MGLFKRASATFGGMLDAIVFEQTDWKDGKKPYSTISAKLTISKDGADDAIEQFLEAGFIYPDRGQSISADGTTLEGGAGVGENTEFARFVQLAVEKGFDAADLLDADGNGTNFSAMTEKRYEFGRAINTERQMASGRRKLGIKDAKGFGGKLGKVYTEAEVMEAGRKQDKKDKSVFYNQTYLIVESLLGGDVSVGAIKPMAPAKTVKTTTTVAAKGKPNGKAIEVEPDYETADALLVDALGNAKTNTLKKASLSSVVVKWAVENDKSNEERDAIRSLFADDVYLGRENGWKFDSDGKDKPVSIGA